MELDEIDFGIVRELQNNARLSNKELAASVPLYDVPVMPTLPVAQVAWTSSSPSTEVNPRALGIGLQALISVRLKQHTADDVALFRDYVLGLPAVMRLYHMAGEDDFLIHVGVKDSEDLRELAMSSLTTRPEVAHLETGLIFECVEGLWGSEAS